MAAGVRPGRARRGGARGADRRPRDQGRGDRPSVGRARRGGGRARSSRSATTRTPTSSASRPSTPATGPSRSWSASGTWPRATSCRGRKPGARVPVLAEPLGAKRLRGEMSNGMLCSPRELAISQEHETGILLLPDGADARRRPEARRSVSTTPCSTSRSNRTGPTSSPSTASRARPRRSYGRSARRARTTTLEEDGGASRRGRDVELRAPDGCPSLPRAGCSEGPPEAPPRLTRTGAADGRGDAAGRADRRRDELRDAGARPAAACVRPAPARRSRDRGSPGRATGSGS